MSLLDCSQLHDVKVRDLYVREELVVVRAVPRVSAVGRLTQTNSAAVIDPGEVVQYPAVLLCLIAEQIRLRIGARARTSIRTVQSQARA